MHLSCPLKLQWRLTVTTLYMGGYKWRLEPHLQAVATLCGCTFTLQQNFELSLARVDLLLQHLLALPRRQHLQVRR